MTIVAASANAESSLPIVRSMSRISVPRPGPISANVTGKGRPIASQARIDHRPISSPNVADFRGSDEVAFDAEWLAGCVVAVIGVEQAKRHVVGDRERAVAPRSTARSYASAATRSFMRRWVRRRAWPSPSPRRRRAASASIEPCPWSASHQPDSRVAGRARGRTRRRCATARSRNKGAADETRRSSVSGAMGKQAQDEKEESPSSPAS